MRVSGQVRAKACVRACVRACNSACVRALEAHDFELGLGPVVMAYVVMAYTGMA